MMICGQLYVLSYFITLNFRFDVQEENVLGSRAVELKLSRLTDTTPVAGLSENEIRVNIHSFKESEGTGPESLTNFSQSINSSAEPPRFSKVETERDLSV